MNYIKNLSPISVLNGIILGLLIISSPMGFAQGLPFAVYENLFVQSDEDSLGLPTGAGTETITIFAPSDSTDKFSNGVFMTAFKGNLYCQWQSSALDEDAPDTWVAYGVSLDSGKTWSQPMALAPTIANGYSSSGGWWVFGDTLVAYINTWPATISPRGGYTRYTKSADGINWSPIEVVTMANGDTLNGIFEQDPDALPDGRIISAAHFQPGIVVAPIYTDDPLGTSGWTKANFSNLSVSSNVSREIEPSWFLRGTDTVVMVFRDQSGSYKKLASFSTDRGENWSTPVLTKMPDARTKQSAGNFPDGTAYLVGNPRTNKTRIPLAVTLSEDGYWFNTAYLLRKGGDGLQPLRYEGLYKRLGYHYPKSMVWNEHLYVSYATNKEDVEYTRVPLSSLVLSDIVNSTLPELSEGIDIFFTNDGVIRISLADNLRDGSVHIYSMNGQLVYQQVMTSQELRIDAQNYQAGNYVIDVRTNKGRKARMFYGKF